MGRQFFTGTFFKQIAALLPVLFFLTLTARAQDSVHRGQGFAEPDTVRYDDAPREYIEDEEDYGDEEVEEQTEVTHFIPYSQADIEREKTNYRLTSTPDSVLKGWKEKDEFWYADKAFNVKRELPRERKRNSSFWSSEAFFNLLLIIAFVAFAALLVVFLSQNGGLMFRRSKNIERTEADREEIPLNLFDIDFDRAIERAEQQANHRMAIRLRFLRLLRQLSDRNIIQYLDDRTNLDYLMQLQQSPWYNDFFRLMRHFEYSWYGLFDVNAEQYARIRSDFEQVNKKFY